MVIVAATELHKTHKCYMGIEVYGGMGWEAANWGCILWCVWGEKEGQGSGILLPDSRPNPCCPDMALTIMTTLIMVQA